jgi:adenylate kinase family enzyme
MLQLTLTSNSNSMPNPRAHATNLILLGDPAAGKATHAQYLCKRFKMYDLDMGKELRTINNPILRKKLGLDQTYDKGKLSPTQVVRKILHDKIHSTPKSLGILFDGTPKMLGEAKLVAKWLKAENRNKPLVVYLTIPMIETVRRMTERKQDFQGKFSKRSDDNRVALKERVKYYRKNIAEVVNFFKKLYKFKKISSNAPIPKVRKVLVKLITDYEKGLNKT